MDLTAVAVGALALVACLAVYFAKTRQLQRELADVRSQAARELAASQANDRVALAEVQVRAAKAQQELADAAAHIQALAKFETCVDAEKRAEEIVAEGQMAAAHAMTLGAARATGIVAVAREHATVLTAEAASLRDSAKTKLAIAEERLDLARREAGEIVEHARKRAEEVGGEALEAKRNADRYAQAAEAMKNVIDGYGDKYLVPTFSVLDALAEEYGFDDAGKKLKTAREHTRWMIANDKAAACDYVEHNRKKTAIEFVLDAFNGKVDTVLASVKRDNYGTLQQKVHDAFAVVNFNGHAFRNARILEDYLDARLQELKWAVAVQELREKDKEEQRELRERIREEEKARREYERAMREAAKEEELLLKLRAKLQIEFDKATDEQKAKYEKQLEEVAEKLRAAEEKNQRALSMAQQTRSGHVYVISNEGSFGEGVLKIGLTRRLEPLDRVRELGDASVPFAFDVHAMIRSDDAPTLERELHKRFVEGQMNKVNPRKEFFRVHVEQVRRVVEQMGIAATWTIAAAAREYRETLAIEKAMHEKTLDVRQWAERQVEERDAAMKQEVATAEDEAA